MNVGGTQRSFDHFSCITSCFSLLFFETSLFVKTREYLSKRIQNTKRSTEAFGSLRRRAFSSESIDLGGFYELTTAILAHRSVRSCRFFLCHCFSNKVRISKESWEYDIGWNKVQPLGQPLLDSPTVLLLSFCPTD